MLRFFAATAAATLFATPAMADSFYAELHTGYDGVTFAGDTYGGVAYGGGLGYEVTVSGQVYAAVEANADDSTTKSSFLGVKSGRDLSAIAKLGVGITEDISIYALGGYTNARLKGPGGAVNLDGVRAGLGWRYKIGKTYVKGEFLYSNYEQGVARYQGMAGIGYQF